MQSATTHVTTHVPQNPSRFHLHADHLFIRVYHMSIIIQYLIVSISFSSIFTHFYVLLIIFTYTQKDQFFSNNNILCNGVDVHRSSYFSYFSFVLHCNMGFFLYLQRVTNTFVVI